MSSPRYTREEIMTVTAARQLVNGAVCFVGIGLPSVAANLARRTHAPGCVLVYESGTIGAKPEQSQRKLPPSVCIGPPSALVRSTGLPPSASSRAMVAR